MAEQDREDLIREHRAYDARCDAVSCFEVFFRGLTSMTPTVAHFERFPCFAGADGQDATPDFTVFFRDGSLLVGEISNLARQPKSLESLLHQLGRYHRLEHGPSAPRTGGGHDLAPVSEVDVMVLIPNAEANFARDRINAAIQDAEHDYDPENRPTVLGYAYEDVSGRFVFTYDDRADNPRPRAHGREPSLASWLEGQSDTLFCASRHFAPVTVARRFMNDRPPPSYAATVLWLEILPALADEPQSDLEVTPAEVAEWMRRTYGWGKASIAQEGLEFLARANLARQRERDWVVALKEIASGREEVRRELVDRYLARPRGPVTAADRREQSERRQRNREQSEQGALAQETFEVQTDKDE